MAEMSKAGRVYERGKATDHDLRQKIIQDIVTLLLASLTEVSTKLPA
jgi:hypothetical protein